ncbi:MAG: membrane dipeptidase [Planctomycetales bacterium]|nr:membrane dipeptidase [Planctomycetales bacterium]
MLIFDGHLDLAMNAVQWNRDISRPLDEVRRREAKLTDKYDRGHGTVTLPEMRAGRVGLCVATQIGHSVAEDNPVPGYNSPEIAWAQTQAQLAWYRAMEERGEMVQIVDRAGLDRHADLWLSGAAGDDAPIGYILSLEGADSIITLGHLERAYGYGLRALGPAHYSVGRYAPGTGVEGQLTPIGRELVQEMARLGVILDITHLTDDSFWEALALYDGPAVWASHNNCRALVPHQRQLSDDMLRALFERDAVIGAAFDAWMMTPGWIRFQTMPQDTGVKIATIVDHIDHICQLAGNARHVGIGSDLDGGYGTEQTAIDLNSIADLQRLTGLLGDRGYSADDIAGIMHGNWLRVLRRAWG